MVLLQDKNSGLLVAAVFFAFVGCVHLIRLFTNFAAEISGISIPIWVSLVAFLVSWVLAGWLLYLRKQ